MQPVASWREFGHTNNCPVGVATQREELRARFPARRGLGELFHLCAEEVRPSPPKWATSLSTKSLAETICLNKRTNDPKTNHLDLSLLTTPGKAGSSKARINQKVHDDGELLDDILLADAGVKKCIETQGTHTVSSKIVNETAPLWRESLVTLLPSTATMGSRAN